MMKKILLFLFVMLPLLAVSQPNASLKNVKVSGGFTMTSITKGLLPPRVTTAERDAINSPAEGLLVYNTDLSELQFFSGGWLTVGGGGGDGDGIYDGNGSLSGGTTVTMGANALTFDGNLTTFKGINAASSSFVGLFTDNVNTNILRIENDGHVGINTANPSQQLHVITNGGINDGAGIRFENGIGDFFEFGGDGPTSSGTPTIRSQNTGNNGVGSFHIHEIAVANDVLNASPEKSMVGYQIQRIGGGQIVNARLYTIGNSTLARWMVMPDGSMLFFTASAGFLGTNVPDTEMDFRMAQAHVFGIRNGETVGNDATQNSPIVRLSGPYDSDPGGGTTSADFKSEIRTFVTTAGASPTGRMAFSVEGNEGLAIDENGNVGIGTTDPETSAILDISSTTGALLVTRMNTAARDALTAVNGMIIYNSQTNAFNFYENGSWVTK